jgi:predicted  nucleic acid-binding Zn-ribbon protein
MSLVLKVDILGDFKDLTKATKGAEKKVKGFGETSKKVSSAVKLAWAAVGAVVLATGKEIFDVTMDLSKAALEDAKSQKLLATQLGRNAKATKTQIQGAEKFITKLSLQSAVADDKLRPALGRLALATKSTSKAQKLLTIAMDIATGTGKPLDAVVAALSKSFNGSDTALKRLIPSLVKSKNPINDAAKAFKGLSAQQADPFQKLQVAIGEIQESLGTVFLPFFEDAAKRIGDAVNEMLNPKSAGGRAFEDVKKSLSELVQAIGDFFGIKVDPNKSQLVQILERVSGILDDITASIKTVKPFFDFLNQVNDSPVGAGGQSKNIKKLNDILNGLDLEGMGLIPKGSRGNVFKGKNYGGPGNSTAKGGGVSYNGGMTIQIMPYNAQDLLKQINKARKTKGLPAIV